MQVRVSKPVTGTELCPDFSSPSSSKEQREPTQTATTSEPPFFEDLSLPVALRKCTQNPISNFISFNKLSPSHSALLSQLIPIEIPQTVQEALRKEYLQESHV